MAVGMCSRNIVKFSKTYHYRFLLKPYNVEASCDFIYNIYQDYS